MRLTLLLWYAALHGGSWCWHVNFAGPMRMVSLENRPSHPARHVQSETTDGYLLHVTTTINDPLYTYIYIYLFIYIYMYDISNRFFLANRQPPLSPNAFWLQYSILKNSQGGMLFFRFLWHQWHHRNGQIEAMLSFKCAPCVASMLHRSGFPSGREALGTVDGWWWITQLLSSFFLSPHVKL